MRTAAGDLGHSCSFRVLTILTAILTIGVRPTRTRSVRALVFICHVTHPAFSIVIALNYSRVSGNIETATVDAVRQAEWAAFAAANVLRRFATSLLRNECARLDYQFQTIHPLQARQP